MHLVVELLGLMNEILGYFINMLNMSEKGRIKGKSGLTPINILFIDFFLFLPGCRSVFE